MASRLWWKGMAKVSQLGWRIAREGFQAPVPQPFLNHLVKKIADPTLRDLRLQIAPHNRLILTGLKKKGFWVSFCLTFAVEPPAAEDPDRSLILRLEEATPFFARKMAQAALAELDEISVVDNRIQVNLDEVINQNQWARKIPRTLQDRLRITQAYTQGKHLYLQISLA